MVALVEVGGSLGIGDFHQEVEQIVLAGITGLVKLFVARVGLGVLAVGHIVEVAGPLVIERVVTSEPSLEPESTEIVVILFGLVGVLGVGDFLLGSKTVLEGVSPAGGGVAAEGLEVFQGPGFEDHGVQVFGLHDLVLPGGVVEVEDLGVMRVGCWRGGTYSKE